MLRERSFIRRPSLQALAIIENFHATAKKIASAVVPAAVLAKGFTTNGTAVPPQNHQYPANNFQPNGAEHSPWGSQQPFGGYVEISSLNFDIDVSFSLKS